MMGKVIYIMEIQCSPLTALKIFDNSFLYLKFYFTFLIIFLISLLEYNCFTVLC